MQMHRLVCLAPGTLLAPDLVEAVPFWAPIMPCVLQEMSALPVRRLKDPFRQWFRNRGGWMRLSSGNEDEL